MMLANHRAFIIVGNDMIGPPVYRIHNKEAEQQWRGSCAGVLCWVGANEIINERNIGAMDEIGYYYGLPWILLMDCVRERAAFFIERENILFASYLIPGDYLFEAFPIRVWDKRCANNFRVTRFADDARKKGTTLIGGHIIRGGMVIPYPRGSTRLPLW